MDSSNPKQRIEKLKSTINSYRYEYHVLDRQSISDSALDSLKKELFDLEQLHPNLITPDSPTQRVGGQPLEKFKKITHENKMISLNDAFSHSDMQEWLKRVANHLNSDLEKLKNAGFYCDPKMDGLAIELVYKGGVLVTGATRGNGLIGEDVTNNIKTIEAIPLKLTQEVDVTVRGEVFLTKKEFLRMNKEQATKDQPAFANPRNIAAGSIRQLDPNVTASRKLDFFAYSLINDQDVNDKYKRLKKLGFKINPLGKLEKSLSGVFSFFKTLEKKRDSLDYEIDGLVVTINNNEVLKQAGIVGKAPRGAIAYKFPAEERTTKVLDIRVQIGRTGAITPVADLEPVLIAGARIKHATLHNYDEITRLGLKIGDTVVVSRAGDVIPKIIKVLSELRNGKEKSFKMPSHCPIDDSKIVKDGAIYRCSNPRCGARARKNLYHFVSRNAFNIEHLGPKIIDKFLDEGLISDCADIFNLEEDEIRALERFGDKSAQNIIQEVNSRKTITLPRFLYSLGILNVGEETAILLANQLGQVKTPLDVLNRALKLTRLQLQNTKDIGPVVAKSIFDWFQDSHNQKLLTKLNNAGIKIENKAQSTGNKKLTGKTFVLTGTLKTMTREQAKEKIRALDADVSSSVSKKTSFLLAGDNAGSKLTKARTLGVKILTEADFQNLIK